jgi:hypothetical protein
MINKEEMLALVRSVAVSQDVEDGMGHAFDLGVDFERARIEKILTEWLVQNTDHVTLNNVLKDIQSGVQYP